MTSNSPKRGRAQRGGGDRRRGRKPTSALSRARLRSAPSRRLRPSCRARLKTSPTLLRRLATEHAKRSASYVFRPLLVCRWIERQIGQVPMLFAQLVESVLEEADVRAALAELVARKHAGDELAVAPPVEALSRFIKAELPRLEALNEPDDSAGEVEELNGFFRRYALAV